MDYQLYIRSSQDQIDTNICRFCGYSLVGTKARAAHERTHVRSFQCTLCVGVERSWTTASRARAHKRQNPGHQFTINWHKPRVIRGGLALYPKWDNPKEHISKNLEVRITRLETDNLASTAINHLQFSGTSTESAVSLTTTLDDQGYLTGSWEEFEIGLDNPPQMDDWLFDWTDNGLFSTWNYPYTPAPNQPGAAMEEFLIPESPQQDLVELGAIDTDIVAAACRMVGYL